MTNNYYVYVYLDPRKKGEFVYGDYKFEYEPFYVGKGKGNRYKEHLKNSSLNKGSNVIKERKLNKILKLGLLPIIIKIKENLSEDESLMIEQQIIFEIGRLMLKTGPLTNLTDGGDGTSGRLISEEFKLEQSERMKNFYSEQSERMKNFYSENPIPKHVCEKISEKLKSLNMVRSNDTRDKISKANKNRKYSDEYINHIKNIRKGPKLTHRKKYILINPNQISFEFLGKEELVDFVHENELSERKILSSINKGVITINDVRLTKNTDNIKTKNCVGWEVKKQKH